MFVSVWVCMFFCACRVHIYIPIYYSILYVAYIYTFASFCWRVSPTHGTPHAVSTGISIFMLSRWWSGVRVVVVRCCCCSSDCRWPVSCGVRVLLQIWRCTRKRHTFARRFHEVGGRWAVVLMLRFSRSRFGIIAYISNAYTQTRFQCLYLCFWMKFAQCFLNVCGIVQYTADTRANARPKSTYSINSTYSSAVWGHSGALHCTAARDNGPFCHRLQHPLSTTTHVPRKLDSVHFSLPRSIRVHDISNGLRFHMYLSVHLQLLIVSNGA